MLYFLIKLRHTSHVIIFVKLAIYLLRCGFLARTDISLSIGNIINDLAVTFPNTSDFFIKNLF